jgi:hypothetical protein
MLCWAPAVVAIPGIYIYIKVIQHCLIVQIVQLPANKCFSFSFSLYINVYVYMYLYADVYVFVHVYVYIRYMYMWTSTYMGTPTYITHMYRNKYMCIWIYT